MTYLLSDEAPLPGLLLHKVDKGRGGICHRGTRDPHLTSPKRGQGESRPLALDDIASPNARGTRIGCYASQKRGHRTEYLSLMQMTLTPFVKGAMPRHGTRGLCCRSGGGCAGTREGFRA